MAGTQAQTEELSGLWTVTDLTGFDLPASVTVTLAIEPDRISGSAGCSRYTAPLEFGGRTLTLGELTADNAICDAASMEAQAVFLTLMTRVTGYRMEPDGTLTLIDADETLLMRAVR